MLILDVVNGRKCWQAAPGSLQESPKYYRDPFATNKGRLIRVIRTASRGHRTPWLIVAGDFAQHGGMDRANYALAWHLAERRNRPITLVAHHVSQPLASHKRVQVVAVPRPGGQHLLGQPLLDYAGRRAAARLVADRPDARVLVNGANCRWPGINWVHMVHNACPADDAIGPLAFRIKNRLSRWLFRQQETARLGLSQLVIANSKKTRQDILGATQLPPQRVTVSYLGCDPHSLQPVHPAERASSREQLGLHESRPVLGFVGALGYGQNKGFGTLLRACAKVQQASKLRPFIVAAGSGQLDFWRQKAVDAGLAKDVRLLGLVDNVPRLLAAMDLLVSPTRYDAYGLAVHEALCRGIPAIVSSRAGIAERYPTTLRSMILSTPDCEHELASQIIAALENLSQIRPRVEFFGEDLRARSWDDMAADIVTLVEGKCGHESSRRPQQQPCLS